MPNGDATKFPTFPTAFTEKEQRRMVELEERRRELEKVYQAKFTPEVWAKVSPVEKAVRWVLPSWLSPVVKAVTPWEEGAWDYGFTPEQFQEYRFELEEEYKELVRQEKVTRLLPSIETDLAIAALSGQPIIDMTELLSNFPELRTDFTEEERGYLASLAQMLAHASPEDIISGKVFAYEPSQLPITAEDVEALARDPLFMEPGHILSTVAFSKNLNEITSALQQAFPPQVEEVAVEVDEAVRQRILDYFTQRAIDLGIAVEGLPIREIIKKTHEQIAEEEGELFTMSDEETGDFIVTRKKSDNTLWLEDELVGYYDEKTNSVVPLDFSGEPLVTEWEREGFLKDAWDSFYLGCMQAWQGGKAGLESIMVSISKIGAPAIPEGGVPMPTDEQWRDLDWLKKHIPPGTLSAILPPAYNQYKAYENLSEEELVGLIVRGKERINYINKKNENLNQALRANYEQRQTEFQEWLVEHPDYLPKPGYEGNPFDNPELFRDPGWYAHIILSNAPVIGTALGIGIAVSVITRNPWAGAVAGAAVITPIEIGSVYDDLIASGASPTNAADLGTSVGILIGAVEILPGFIVMKAVSPTFMRIFRRNLQKELVTQLVAGLSIRGVLGTAAKIEIAETLEEVIQQAMQNAAVKTVDENRSILEGLDQTAITAAIATAPLALFGGGTNYLTMRANLPPKTQKQIDDTTEKLEDAGLTHDHAEAVSFNKVLETEQGQAQVEMAKEKAEEVVPSRPKIPKKIENLEAHVKTISEEIGVFSESIGLQEERLAKILLPHERTEQIEVINGLKGRMAELEAQRAKTLKIVQKLRKTQEVSVPEEVLAVPEITPVPMPEHVIQKKLDEVGEGVPGFSKETLHGYQGNILVYRNPEGKPIAVMGVSYATGEPVVGYVVARGKGLLVGRAAQAFKQELIEVNAELPDVIEMTEQGRAIAEKYRESLVRVSPAEVVEESWDSLSYGEKLSKATDAGIAKTAATKEWSKLTSVQQERILGVPVPAEAAPLEGRTLTPDRRPRLKDWADEQETVRDALADNRSILGAIKLSRRVREARAEAERVLEGLQSRLEEATGDEETKLVTDEFGILSKESGLRKKRLLASHWGDLTPPEQGSLALATIPNKSITFPVKREIFDIRYYMQFLEEETGLPFYSVFKRAELSHGAARIAGEQMLQRVGQDPNFTHIRTDAEALARVTQEINARNPLLKVEHPEVLSDQELLLANVVGEIYNRYEPKVRYLRFMRAAPNIESLKKAFPDAVEAGKEVELALALELRDKGELDGLYSFLETCDWGVIGSGYDPWIVSLPTLVPARVSLATTRGAARLMRRETVEFPQGMEKNVLLRLSTYIKQLEAQWRLEPELDVFEDLWSQAGEKITNKGQVESALREWTRELQGIPTRQSFLDAVIRRVWRQAMSAVFLHPWMAFRNFHQALAFHPDRTELFRLVAQKPSPAMQEMGRVYFSSFVSQLKGIRRDWLYMGERGLPGLGWITRLSDRLSLYSHSDNIPRRWSFEASVNKATRATEQYQKDGKVANWLKNSGAIHLRQTERNYALQLLAQPTHDLAVPGLREVSGGEMASLYIGHEVANLTHFIYERAFRAPVEMGATGRTIFNLIVFPRGYFQRFLLQSQKVFGRETTWQEARAGFKDILLLVTVGMLVSEWLRKVTGRPRRAYNAADIIQWQLGGLVIGVGMDLTAFLGDLVTAADPTVDPEHKRDVLARLPGMATRLADVLLPFYRTLMDSLEAVTDVRGIDVYALRQLRAMIDEKYTPEELEEMDRNLWEKLRKAVLAGEPPDPTRFQEMQTSLIEAQARLGEMDAEGRFYTLSQFAGDIRTFTKPLPDDMFTEDYNFSDLVIFYKECEDNWKELYGLPSSPASVRKEWRESHVETEAMLLFWGMYSGSVFRRGTSEWNEVARLLQIWFDLYSIDKRMHKEWADWSLTQT